MITPLARRKQSGVALITTMIIVMIAAGMAAAFLSLAFAQSNNIGKASRGEIALHVAEAGIDDAINKLNAYAIDFVANGSKAPTYTSPIPDYAEIQNPSPAFKGSMNQGTYVVTLANTAGTSPAFVDPFSTNYLIHSTGRHGAQVQNLEVITSAIDNGNLFKYGLFGDVVVDAGGTFTSDGYKSSGGPYNATQTHTFPDGKTVKYANATGSLGSNGNIITGGNAMVMGNATPGPGGSISGGGNVSGSTTPAPATENLEPVSYPKDFTGIPSATWASGDLTLAGGAVGSPVSYHAADLNPTGKGTFTVKGDVVLYVDGDFNMNNQQAIVIETGGKLTIKQGPGSGNIHINGQAFAGTAKAADFQVYSASSGDIQFNGGSTVYAAVYAPQATFTNNGGNEFFGSMVASTMKLKGTASFHYDEDLAKLSTPKPQFKIISWRKVNQ